MASITLRVAAATILLSSGCAMPTTQVAVGDSAAVELERREQARFATKTWAERSKRVDRVSWPILVANADICPKTRARAGFTYRSRWDTGDNLYRETAEEMLGLQDRFVVVGVVPGSPAAEAGLRDRDAILAVEGEVAPTPTSTRAHDGASRSLARLMDRAVEDGVLTLRVSRTVNGTTPETVDISVETIQACDYPVFIADGDELNAYADGSAIYLTVGMLRFASTDLELQTVIAHELAHNTEGHIDKVLGNALLGGILGALVDVAAASQGIYTNVTQSAMQVGAHAFSQEFEREADYVGIYFMERAGVDSTEAATFWRRMAAENPNSIAYGRTHPTTPERFVNLTAAVAEVHTKRVKGNPLLPERKRRTPPKPAPRPQRRGR